MTGARAWLYIAALLVVRGAIAEDQPAAPLPGFGVARPMRLKELDEGIRIMRELPWHLLENAGQLAPDDAGRTLEQDIDDYYMVEPVLKTMTSLRDQLAAAYQADAVIPVSALQPVRQVLSSEDCRISMLVTYWGTQRLREFHRDMIQHLIADLPEADRAAADTQLHDADTRSSGLRAQVPAAMNRCRDVPTTDAAFLMQWFGEGASLIRISTDILDELNALRQRLAVVRDKARETAGQERAWTQRSVPCPAPADELNSKPMPAYRVRPDMQGYYPPQARSMQVAGTVRAMAGYDSTGCIIAVSIADSSGSDELDDAATRFVFDVALTPGEVDGKAVSGVVVIPVRFSMRN
jgi:TonB family protein